MRRPEIPHKKTLGVIVLILFIALAAIRLDFVPRINPWWYLVALTPIAIYVIYWAIRQECWGYAMMYIGFMVVLGVMIGVTNYLSASFDAQTAGAATTTAAESSSIPVGIIVAFVICIVMLIFDFVAIYFIIRRKRYPRVGSLMRQLLWPVSIAMTFFAWLSIILVII